MAKDLNSPSSATTTTTSRTTVRLKARRALRMAVDLLKDNSLLSARRHLEATRDALQAAHMEMSRLLEAQDAMNDDDKSTSAIVRKARSTTSTAVARSALRSPAHGDPARRRRAHGRSLPRTRSRVCGRLAVTIRSLVSPDRATAPASVGPTQRAIRTTSR